MNGWEEVDPGRSTPPLTAQERATLRACSTVTLGYRALADLEAAEAVIRGLERTLKQHDNQRLIQCSIDCEARHEALLRVIRAQERFVLFERHGDQDDIIELQTALKEAGL